jgi:hypothetical protein
MNSRFTFGPLLYSKTPREGIEEADYRTLRDARNVLLATLEIEDNFSCLIDNYLEFEREGLSIAAEHCVRTLTHEAIRRDRLALSRRIANVLAAARSFLDQLDRTFKYHFREQREALTSVRHAQHDERLGYRVMEAIRNIATHKGNILHALIYPSSRTDQGVEVRVVPMLIPEQLQGLGVKATLLAELDSGGSRYPLGRFLRDYIEGLGVIRQRAVELSSDKFAGARDAFEKWIAIGENTWGEQPGFDVNDADDPAATFHVVPRFIETCRQARAQQYRLTNLTNVFVSGHVGD